MARIKINNLPKGTDISQEEMKKVFGGLLIGTNTSSLTTDYNLTLSTSARPEGAGEWFMATDRETGRTLFNPTGGIITPGVS